MHAALQDAEGRHEFVHECADIVSRTSDLFPDNVVPAVVRIPRLVKPILKRSFPFESFFVWPFKYAALVHTRATLKS